MSSFRTLLRSFAIIISLTYSLSQRTTVLKIWPRKLRTMALPAYFMVFKFDYGPSNYQLYTFLNIALCL